MKYIITFLLYLCLSVNCFASYQAGSINVQMYGAIPNDGIDDTAAIQRAINAVKNKYVVNELRFYYYNQVVYFPPGLYDISGSLVVPQNVEQIEGDGAVLQQHLDASDTFTSTQFFQLKITGLKFLGGRHAIKITNSNLDTSRLTIEDCEFGGNNDYSIFHYNSSSTLLLVKGCRFLYTNKVLHNSSDWGIFKDSWVTVNGSPNGNAIWTTRSTDPDSQCNDVTKPAGGVFCNGGILTIEGLLGVPNIANNRLQFPRWIDNIDTLYINRARFGGESGGMPIVYDYGSDPIVYGGAPRVVSVIDSQTCGGGAGGQPDGTDATDSAIVNLRTSVPRLIKLSGNTCITDMPYIRGGNVDLVAFFAAIQSSNPPVDRFFKFIIEPNNFVVGNEQYTIPLPMEPFVFVPLPIGW